MDTTGNDLQRETSDTTIPDVARKLLAHVPTTVLVIGNDFRPVWFSSPDGRLFGREPDTWQPGTLSDCLHPSDQLWLKRKRHEILEYPELPIRGHVRVKEPDGGYAACLLTAVNRFDDPDVNGLIITVTPTADAGLGSLVNEDARSAKITSGTMKLESIVFSPARLLHDVTSAFELPCARRGLELTLRLDPELPAQAKGDPARLEQVIDHLVSNVIGSATRNDVVIEAIAVNETSIRCRVSNSGETMDTGAGNSFSTAHQRPSDADVRLSIAREIVALMEGSFGHETSNQATTIWFEVQLDHARRIEDHPANTTPMQSSPIPPSSAHVLVVDDSDVNRLLATSQLERLGHTFATADSGQEALDALVSETFDVVLMDWHMPGMDGLEATRRWRAEHDPQHELAIITMTASAMAGDRERCLDAGASDYLSKPVSINDLGAMITRWTQRTSGDRPTSSAANQQHAVRSKAHDAEPPSPDQSSVAALITDLGDRAVVRSIVRAFLDMVPQYRATAEEALVHDDRNTIRRCAHTLKSTALMLGTDELTQACIELEAAAAPGESIDLSVPVADFARCCHRAEITLADLAAQLDTEGAPQP